MPGFDFLANGSMPRGSGGGVDGVFGGVLNFVTIYAVYALNVKAGDVALP